MPAHRIPTSLQVSRAIRRFARAVESKAFEGTIPWDSEEAIAAHKYINEELERAEHGLRSIIIMTTVKKGSK